MAAIIINRTQRYQPDLYFTLNIFYSEGNERDDEDSDLVIDTQ